MADSIERTVKITGDIAHLESSIERAEDLIDKLRAKASLTLGGLGASGVGSGSGVSSALTAKLDQLIAETRSLHTELAKQTQAVTHFLGGASAPGAMAVPVPTNNAAPRQAAPQAPGVVFVPTGPQQTTPAPNVAPGASQRSPVAPPAPAPAVSQPASLPPTPAPPAATPVQQGKPLDRAGELWRRLSGPLGIGLLFQRMPGETPRLPMFSMPTGQSDQDTLRRFTSAVRSSQRNEKTLFANEQKFTTRNAWIRAGMTYQEMQAYRDRTKEYLARKIQERNDALAAAEIKGPEFQGLSLSRAPSPEELAAVGVVGGFKRMFEAEGMAVPSAQNYANFGSHNVHAQFKTFRNAQTNLTKNLESLLAKQSGPTMADIALLKRPGGRLETTTQYLEAYLAGSDAFIAEHGSFKTVPELQAQLQKHAQMVAAKRAAGDTEGIENLLKSPEVLDTFQQGEHIAQRERAMASYTRITGAVSALEKLGAEGKLATPQAKAVHKGLMSDLQIGRVQDLLAESEELSGGALSLAVQRPTFKQKLGAGIGGTLLQAGHSALGPMGALIGVGGIGLSVAEGMKYAQASTALAQSSMMSPKDTYTRFFRGANGNATPMELVSTAEAMQATSGLRQTLVFALKDSQAAAQFARAMGINPEQGGALLGTATVAGIRQATVSPNAFLTNIGAQAAHSGMTGQAFAGAYQQLLSSTMGVVQPQQLSLLLANTAYAGQQDQIAALTGTNAATFLGGVENGFTSGAALQGLSGPLAVQMMAALDPGGAMPKTQEDVYRYEGGIQNPQQMANVMNVLHKMYSPDNPSQRNYVQLDNFFKAIGTTGYGSAEAQQIISGLLGKTGTAYTSALANLTANPNSADYKQYQSLLSSYGTSPGEQAVTILTSIQQTEDAIFNTLKGILAAVAKGAGGIASLPGGGMLGIGGVVGSGLALGALLKYLGGGGAAGGGGGGGLALGAALGASGLGGKLGSMVRGYGFRAPVLDAAAGAGALTAAPSLASMAGGAVGTGLGAVDSLGGLTAAGLLSVAGPVGGAAALAVGASVASQHLAATHPQNPLSRAFNWIRTTYGLGAKATGPTLTQPSGMSNADFKSMQLKAAYLEAHPDLQVSQGMPSIGAYYAQGKAAKLSGFDLFEYMMDHSGHPTELGSVSSSVDAQLKQAWDSTTASSKPKYFGSDFTKAGVPAQFAAALEAFEGNVAPNQAAVDSGGYLSVGPLQEYTNGGQGDITVPAGYNGTPNVLGQNGTPTSATADNSGQGAGGYAALTTMPSNTTGVLSGLTSNGMFDSAIMAAGTLLVAIIAQSLGGGGVA